MYIVCIYMYMCMCMCAFVPTGDLKNLVGILTGKGGINLEQVRYSLPHFLNMHFESSLYIHCIFQGGWK